MSISFSYNRLTGEQKIITLKQSIPEEIRYYCNIIPRTLWYKTTEEHLRETQTKRSV